MIAVLLVIAAQVPANAARADSRMRISVFSLQENRVVVFRNNTNKRGITTIRQFKDWSQRTVLALTTSFSDRQGWPIDLFVYEGYVHQGNGRARCLFWVDRSGHKPGLGYAKHFPRPLNPEKVYYGFAAGPCIFRATKPDGRPTIDIGSAKENFKPGFISGGDARNVLCIDRRLTMIVVFQFTGSLWRIAKPFVEHDLDRCINLDGGSQAREDAKNPAVLGIVRSKSLADILAR